MCKDALGYKNLHRTQGRLINHDRKTGQGLRMCTVTKDAWSDQAETHSPGCAFEPGCAQGLKMHPEPKDAAHDSTMCPLLKDMPTTQGYADKFERSDLWHVFEHT